MIPVSKPSLGPDELAAVGRVFDTGWLGMGAVTHEFEEALQRRLGRKYVIATNTGTTALHLALEGLGVGAGDEVIVPSLTYAASIQAILACGATPVLCDCRESDILIDVDDVRRLLTPRTKAVMPVHYAGKPCDMDELLDLGAAHGFVVVEDAAHAIGSMYRGRPIGSFGDATCFSFDPIKVITTGEGGAIALDDEEQVELMRRKRILGIDNETMLRYQNSRSWAYEVTTQGYRYHMPNFNAAIGLVQLEHMDEYIARRQAVCRRYDSSFAELSRVRLLDVDYTSIAPFMYVVRVLDGRREAFSAHLKSRGVQTGVHYIPNHCHPFFKPFVRGSLHHTEVIGDQICTLPLYSSITDEDVDTVISAVLEFENANR